MPTRGEQGELIRALFTAPPGMMVVGCDASNIEARMLAHYMARYHDEHRLANAFRDKLDFHQANADAWGVERTPAKSILFSSLYGAGATKIGGGDKAKGEAILANVRANCPAMFDIKDTVWGHLRRGGGVIHTWLGRRLVYPNINSKDRSLKAADERASFNAILQGTAADVFKATILSTAHDSELICGTLVANVHDEGQWYVPEEQAEQFACEVTKHFQHDYGLSCPLDGEAKVGLSWHEVH